MFFVYLVLCSSCCCFFFFFLTLISFYMSHFRSGSCSGCARVSFCGTFRSSKSYRTCWMYFSFRICLKLYNGFSVFIGYVTSYFTGNRDGIVWLFISVLDSGGYYTWLYVCSSSIEAPVILLLHFVLNLTCIGPSSLVSIHLTTWNSLTLETLNLKWRFSGASLGLFWRFSGADF